MNLQRILEYFQKKLIGLDLPEITLSDIKLPNAVFEPEERSLWFELSAEALGLQNSPENIQRRTIYLNCIVSVPRGTGVQRAFNIADRVSRILAPFDPPRSGFFLSDSARLRVRNITQMPPDLTSEGLKINTRFTLDYTTEDF